MIVPPPPYIFFSSSRLNLAQSPTGILDSDTQDIPLCLQINFLYQVASTKMMEAS